MMKKKVPICVGGVDAPALVDTVSSVSVVVLSFRDRRGQKVMFDWDGITHFHGVGGEPMRAVGIFLANVVLGGNTFRTEFTVLKYAKHDVILGIDFLQYCGAMLDCGGGELLLQSVRPSCIEDAIETREGVFAVADDKILPPRSAMFVSVKSRHRSTGSFSAALVEPDASTAIKKCFLPRALIHERAGYADVWTVNGSCEPVYLPSRVKRTVYAEHLSIPLHALSPSDRATTTKHK